jgi:hypothetical protein
VNWALGFFFFGAAWAGEQVGDWARSALFSRMRNGPRKEKLLRAIPALWFFGCFALAAYFFGRTGHVI